MIIASVRLGTWMVEINVELSEANILILPCKNITTHVSCWFLGLLLFRVMPVEEREAKYARYVSSSFLLFNFYLETVGIDATDESIMAVVKLFLTEKKFWKFSKHSSTLVRLMKIILMIKVW